MHLQPTHCAIERPIVEPRVLVSVDGGGNQGESRSSAFWTIDALPPALANLRDASPPVNLARTDLDLGPDRLAFYVDGVLGVTETDALIECAESIFKANGDSRIAPGINTPAGMRINMAAHWYPRKHSVDGFLGGVFERVRHFCPSKLNGQPLYGLSEKVAHFKYGDGDVFHRHTDGPFPGQGCNESGDGVEQWPGVTSGLSMLLYLNDGPADGLVGGETRLWTADGSRFVDVQPRRGRALFFRRGHTSPVLHAGLAVSGAVPKYIALINVAYGRRQGSNEPLY